MSAAHASVSIDVKMRVGGVSLCGSVDLRMNIFFPDSKSGLNFCRPHFLWHLWIHLL